MRAVAIKVQLLLIDRNEDLQRPFLNLADRFPVGAIGGLCYVGFMCHVMFVPAVIPVSRRCRRCGRRYGQACEKCNRVSAAAGDAVVVTAKLARSAIAYPPLPAQRRSHRNSCLSRRALAVTNAPRPTRIELRTRVRGTRSDHTSNVQMLDRACPTTPLYVG